MSIQSWHHLKSLQMLASLKQSSQYKGLNICLHCGVFVCCLSILLIISVFNLTLLVLLILLCDFLMFIKLFHNNFQGFIC